MTMDSETSTPSTDRDNATEVTYTLTITQLVSFSTRETIFQFVGSTAASIAVFGFFTNVANIIVFYKIGFSRPTNICFFALSITDLINVSWIFLLALANCPIFDEGRTIFPLEDVVLIGSTVFYSCSVCGSWATAILSMERCLCVVCPLKVKFIFSRRVVHTLLLLMVVYQVATATPYFFTFDLISVTYPGTNWTRKIVDRKNQDRETVVLSKLLSFSAPTLVCFVLVVFGTVFLVISFTHSRRKRAEMATQRSPGNAVKDRRIVKSVILICSIYIIGFSSNVVLFSASIAYPTLQISNPLLGNLTAVLVIMVFFIQVASCSINIFVYLSTNSSYRAIFETLVPSLKNQYYKAGKG